MSKTKKNIKVRDLKPKKDAKGGGGGHQSPLGGTSPLGGKNPSSTSPSGSTTTQGTGPSLN